jgi:hypothetical protein
MKNKNLNSQIYLKFGQYRLSHYINNKGIQVKENGTVQIEEGIRRISLGTSYSGSSYYLSSYIGFNAQRNSQGQWLFKGDGGNNGGVAVIADVSGNIRFVSVASNGGSDKSIDETSMVNNTKLFINNNGNIGIGTTTPREKLTVKGKILSEEIIVVLDANTSSYPDYVFSDDYNLMSLHEIELFINKYKHLPDVPTVEEVKIEGMKLAEMNIILLKKIEELYLYVIELNKEINDLKSK